MRPVGRLRSRVFPRSRVCGALAAALIALGGAAFVRLAPPEEFTVVLIPDTQHYTIVRTDPTYAGQMRWIRDNAASERIVFGVHLGDVTEDHERTRHEWTVADEAHRILDDAGFPYSMAPGNHDHPKPKGEPLRRNLLLYNYYFGPGRFTARPWYIAHFPKGRNDNSLSFFEGAGLPFMVVSLEYAPTKDAMCWADSVIRANPDRRAIVATHCYLGNKSRATCGTNPEYSIVGADGQVIWDELISRHSSVVLTLGGHINGASHFRSLRPGGGPAPADARQKDVVIEILTNYQSEPPLGALAGMNLGEVAEETGNRVHGNGWLRLLRFVPKDDRLYVAPQTTRPDVNRFTAELDDYPADATADPHTFDVPFDLSKWTPGDYGYSRASPAFFDRTVNDVSDGNQTQPRVGMRASGDFVVVWRDSSRVPGEGYEVRERGFLGHGCERLAPTRVSALADGVQSAPSVAMDGTGGHVVVWHDDADGNGSYEIRARGYDADGRVRFGDLRVNTVSAGQQRNPSVATDPAGNFVVAWEDDSNRNDKMQIRLRGFRADGGERFSQRTVNVVDAGDQLRPRVAMGPSGEFVVVWEDDSEAPRGVFNVFARTYDAAGTPKAPPFMVNESASGDQRRSAVAMANGELLVAWEDTPGNSQGVNVRLRGFRVDGSVWRAERPASDAVSGPQSAPSVAVDPAGRFYVAWEDDGNERGGYEIRARAVGAAVLGPQVTINSNNVGTHRRPSIAASASVVVVAWEDDLEANGKWQIVARGLQPNRF